MKKFSKLLIISSLLVSLILVGCGNSNTKSNAADPAKNSAQPKSSELIISAAASLKDSMTEIQKAYAVKKPEVKLTFNLGASGTLQQQIEQGAPADLFISAGKSQVDALDQKNLLVKESIVNLVGNDLVLVTGLDNKDVTTVQDLTKASVEKIGIGTPESVPAGKYAQEALTTLKLWDTLTPKYVMAKDVTQVLNYVETGNVEAGIVYKSDAQGSKKVKVAVTFSADSHKAIVYPAAVVAATKEKEAAQDFLKYLQTPEAQQIFVKYGFASMVK